MKVTVITPDLKEELREPLPNEGANKLPQFHEGEIVRCNGWRAMVVRGELAGWWYLTDNLEWDLNSYPPYLCEDSKIERIFA